MSSSAKRSSSRGLQRRSRTKFGQSCSKAGTVSLSPPRSGCVHSPYRGGSRCVQCFQDQPSGEYVEPPGCVVETREWYGSAPSVLLCNNGLHRNVPELASHWMNDDQRRRTCQQNSHVRWAIRLPLCQLGPPVSSENRFVLCPHFRSQGLHDVRVVLPRNGQRNGRSSGRDLKPATNTKSDLSSGDSMHRDHSQSHIVLQ
jgi:hypothetical protein